MYTKSLIHAEIDRQKTVTAFKQYMRKMNEEYEIVEAVFGINGTVPSEAVSGYIDVKEEFSDIESALKKFSKLDDCLYVVSPEQVILGTLRPCLSECLASNIVDVSTLEKVIL